MLPDSLACYIYLRLLLYQHQIALLSLIVCLISDSANFTILLKIFYGYYYRLTLTFYVLGPIQSIFNYQVSTTIISFCTIQYNTIQSDSVQSVSEYNNQFLSGTKQQSHLPCYLIKF